MTRRVQHERDPYVRQARSSEYRSRAAFKLEEIDQRDQLLHPGQAIIDLGAAPGGWSQYAARRVGRRGRVIAVDLEAMHPVENVEFIHGDFTTADTVARCREALHGAPVDLVISDVSPHLTGIRVTDQARSMQLAEDARDFAFELLRPGGDLLLKMFQGQGADQFVKELMKQFQRVMNRKPKASRGESREFYVLARGYKV